MIKMGAQNIQTANKEKSLSLLDQWLLFFTKNDTEEQKKDMRIYDTMEFNDVNKSIDAKKKPIQPTLAMSRRTMQRRKTVAGFRKRMLHTYSRLKRSGTIVSTSKKEKI